MPTPQENIPYIGLREINFRAPKRLKLEHSSPSGFISSSVSECKIAPPSEAERDDFFHEIAKEKERKPLILSVIEPHSSMFAESNDHLPTPLQCIFNPAHLDKDYDQLVTLANNFSMHTVTQEMLEHLAKMTCDQAKSKQWFRFRAGRITASCFKQAVCTNSDQPSLSLLKGVCFPEMNKFTTTAAEWDCQHEKFGIQDHQARIYDISRTASHLKKWIPYQFRSPILGASPDAPVEWKCCSKGVVEIKCPYNCCNQSLEDDACEGKYFCLEKLSDGTLKLKRDHSYYYQCQMQIFSTRRAFCDFVVWSSICRSINFG